MKKNVQRLLPWAVLALAYLASVAVYACIGMHNLNADIASEMVLADLLNREGALLSANWYYSTELRVVSPVPVYQLALRIFPGNWHMARTLSMAVLLAAFAASMAYMGRGAGHEKPAVYTAAALMLPLSEVHRFLFSGGGFYTAYVIWACVLIGMVLRLPRAKYRHISLVQLAILSLIGGLTGVRMLMICGVPLAMACALEAWDALRRADSLPGALNTDAAHTLLGACVSLAAMLVGYLVNAKVLSAVYHFSSYGDMAVGTLELGRLGDQIAYLMGFFGLSEGMPLLSLGGVADMLTVCVFGVMVLAACVLLGCREKLAAGTRLLTYFAVFAVALGMLINLLTGVVDNRYAVGYYMMGAYALAMLAFVLVDVMRCRMAWVRTLAMVSLCGVFLLQGMVFVRNYMSTKPSEHEEAAQWLAENGYENGFATFWNGNILTELSSGKLDMYLYGEWNEGELTPWLQEVSHLEAQPEGNVFVFVSGVEYYRGGVPCADDAHLVYTSERFGSRIYAYDSAAEVIAIQRAQGMN